MSDFVRNYVNNCTELRTESHITRYKVGIALRYIHFSIHVSLQFHLTQESASLDEQPPPAACGVHRTTQTQNLGQLNPETKGEKNIFGSHFDTYT